MQWVWGKADNKNELFLKQKKTKKQKKKQKKKKKTEIARCQYDNLLYSRQSYPSDISATPRRPLLEVCAYICYSRGAIAERFTDKFENARDAIFSHAYLKTDFG